MTTARDDAKRKLSRRAFLKSAGAVAAAGGAGAMLAGCQPQSAAQPAPTPVLDLDDKYLHVPPAPRVPPDPNVLVFFTPEEARTLDAFVGRLLPGTPDDPGAREAGVVNFIDQMLGTTDGYAEPTYTAKPYARFYSGEAPPPEAQDADPREVIWVPEAWRSNYGWQTGVPPQRIYRAGLAGLDEWARAAAGAAFADLSEGQQDGILEILAGESGDGPGDAFDLSGLGVSAADFFDMLKTHTIYGMFADPLYGGNRYLAGWQLIGYPGARRAYTPHDMQTEGTPLEPQSLANLPPFHPGQRVSDDVIIPLADGRVFAGPPQEQLTEQQRLNFCRIKND